MNMITPQDLREQLGPIRESKVYLEMPSREFSRLPGLAPSALVDYRQHPARAFARRIERTIPWAEHTEAAKKNFRIGHALHAILLEPQKFETDFPIYTGKTKAGKVWDEFKTQHPGAVDDNRVLSKSELKEILELKAAVEPAWKRYFGSVPWIGWFPEASFHVTYANGFSSLCRVDALGFYYNQQGHLCWTVLDVKTTSKDCYSPSDIAYSIDSFQYHAQAAQYLATVEMALLDPAVWNTLLPQVPFGTPSTGEFTFFWLSKEMKAASVQHAFMTSSDPGTDEHSWGNYGRILYLAGIYAYQGACDEFAGKPPEFKGENVVRQISTPLWRNARYAAADAFKIISGAPPLSEIKMKRQIREEFERASGKALGAYTKETDRPRLETAAPEENSFPSFSWTPPAPPKVEGVAKEVEEAASTEIPAFTCELPKFDAPKQEGNSAPAKIPADLKLRWEEFQLRVSEAKGNRQYAKFQAWATELKLEDFLEAAKISLNPKSEGNSTKRMKQKIKDLKC